MTGDEPLEAKQTQNKSATLRLAMNIEIPGRALVSLKGALDAMFIHTVVEGFQPTHRSGSWLEQQMWPLIMV